jgi:hypothetical protein
MTPRAVPHSTTRVVRPRESTVILTLLAAVLCGVALTAFVANARQIDFRLFYLEGLALRHGQPLYLGVHALNMNPPSLTAVVFAPLSLVPFRVAQAVWLALSVAAIGGSVRIVRRELGTSMEQTLRVTAFLLLMHGSLQALALGQLTFPLLLYALTCAWRAFRHGCMAAAGMWLAPAIFIKPPLALLALGLPPVTWIIAGAFSAGATAFTMALTGLAPWRAWLHAGSQVNWLARPFNLSLWGAVARFTSTTARLSDLPSWSLVLGGVTAVALWVRAIREPSSDRRFMLAGLWSLLLAPLGWGYYLPLLFGPAVASWPPSGLAIVAYALTWLPVGGAAAGNPWIDSLGFAGLVLAWMAWTWRPNPFDSGPAGPPATRSAGRRTS